MSRTQGDELVAACCLLPSDTVRREALSDWLFENGWEELKEVVRGKEGEPLILQTTALANFQKVLPSVKLLYLARQCRWAAALLYPTIAVTCPNSPPVVLPVERGGRERSPVASAPWIDSTPWVRRDDRVKWLEEAYRRLENDDK